MSSIGNYNRSMPLTTASVTNASSTIVAAVATADLGSRKALLIKNPATNTGTVYLLFAAAAAVAGAFGNMYALAPGEWVEDTAQVVYQGEVRAILSVAGPETIEIFLGA